MRLGYRISAVLAAMCLIGGMLPGPAHAADFLLRFATINIAATPAYDQILEPFARSIEQASGGRIEVALKGLGGYGKASELFNMVERGDIEIAATVQGYNPGRFPESSVMELPLMFDNAVSGTQAIWKLYKEGLLDRDYASVKVLGLYMLPPYGIFTTGKAITQLRDLRGMRVRSPSPTVGLALAKLGMFPIGIPTDMVSEMLANGTVDAVSYGWDSATTSKGIGDKRLIDQLKVMVDMNFAAPALMVVMNRAKWDALPADLQAAVDANTPILIDGNARLRDQSETATKARLRGDSRFVTSVLTPEQHDAMERTIVPVVADWKSAMAKQGLDGERLYARARELVHQSSTASR
jgi:TRAP-type C4-dicarboxylate transport system substrate-binding protein